jgi:hypothetical protein
MVTNAGDRQDDPRAQSERVDALADEVTRLVAQIRPLLAGRPPRVQGVVLAELLAIWLAGHIDPTNREMTARRRAELLAQHRDNVEELVPILAKGMGLPW